MKDGPIAVESGAMLVTNPSSEPPILEGRSVAAAGRQIS